MRQCVTMIRDGMRKMMRKKFEASSKEHFFVSNKMPENTSPTTSVRRVESQSRSDRHF